MDRQVIDVRGVRIGPGQPLALIAGPCSAESLELCLRVGEAMRDTCARLGFGYIFKASFDKANRTSISSQRGPGEAEGLAMIERVGKELGVPTTTDVHETYQVEAVGQAVDLIQVPAFLCRQTDLLVASAQTGRPVNVKKGQFLSPGEMQSVVGKLTEAKADGIMLTERGTFFGYNRLVNDFAGVGDMLELGWPVCFDVTHSTQLPGATNVSGGRPERAPMLARCAAAAGVDALFVEAHPEPAKGVSDAATMLPIETVQEMLEVVKRVREAVGG